MSMTLLSHHLANLRESGLSDETIAAAGFYSEADPAKNQKTLGWERPADALGPCLVFPFRNLAGEVNCFARLRPDSPRESNGKPVKYEQPKDAALRAYLPPAALPAIRKPFQTLAIVEGEKKALAVTQAGLPCIGLTGITTWSQRKTPDGPRELIDDLAQISWWERTVAIIFDSDPRRNPDVNREAAELARVLEAQDYPEVVIIDLPLGEPGPDGLPRKMGADDFIVAYGPDAFLSLVDSQLRRAHEQLHDVEQYQEKLVPIRVDALNSPPGIIHLDRSATGSGKSTADQEPMRIAGSSLTVLSTHKNCREKEEELEAAGFDAAAYPKICEDTCLNYGEASLAINHGLSASGGVCPTCQFKNDCDFWIGMKRAEGVPHGIATHKRAEMTFATISKGRKYIAIHEDPATLLRPEIELSAKLHDVEKIVKHVRHSLPEGNGWLPFFDKMEEAARFLEHQLQHATETVALPMPQSYTPPATLDAMLYKAMKDTETWPDGDAVRVCKGIAAGNVAQVTIRVDRILTKNSVPAFRRSILAHWQTELPTDATIFICDASADPAEIAALSNRRVIDVTPVGRIVQRHPVVQIPIDLKKSSNREIVLRTIRYAISLHPSAERIGLICDRKHIPAIAGTAKDGKILPEQIRRRIARVEHFRGGEGRGSNSWTTGDDRCDLLIVAGTPRVPPQAIKSRLLRAGKVEAAGRAEDRLGWGPDWWGGRTLSGRRRTIKTLAYRDRDWHRAYLNIVRAEIEQCIGRGRSIRANGIPVVVITTDQVDGAKLIDEEIFSLRETDEKIIFSLAALAIDDARASGVFSKEPGQQPDASELSGDFSKGAEPKAIGCFSYNILEKSPVSSSRIARALNTDDKWVRTKLNRLASGGFVERIGQRGGWKLTIQGFRYWAASCTSAPSPADSARSTAEIPA